MIEYKEEDKPENAAEVSGSALSNFVMPFYSTAEKLPDDGEYVLIYLLKTNWGDDDDKHGKRYWKVAKFVKGITEEDRTKMRNGELPDSVETGWTRPTPPGDWISHENKRSSTYKQGDVHGNNSVPYAWDAFGPGSYFGQEVNIWARLPDLEA